MIKNRTIIFLGVIIAIIPFTGFPIFWRDIAVIALGLITSVLSFLTVKGVVTEYNNSRSRDVSAPLPTFVESPVSIASREVINS